MVNDPFNVNNEGCHFQLFSERVIEWVKAKARGWCVEKCSLEVGLQIRWGNLQHRILWLLPTNWQLKHESKSYFRNLQRGCTPAKLYLFVLWKLFNSQIREWSQSLQDAIYNSRSPNTLNAIIAMVFSTSFVLFIIFSAAERALYPYTVKRRDILARTFPTTKKFPEVGEFCMIDSLKINPSLVIWCEGFWSRKGARRFQDEDWVAVHLPC